MYKATRELITARQPHANCRMEVVKVKQMGGGMANECYDNAWGVVKNDPETSVVSGWLVAAVDKRNMSTAMVSHYWNYKNGEHFDTTPGITSDYEYVADMDLQSYVFKHCKTLDHCISMSLFFKDGGFQLVDGIDGVVYPFGEVYELTTDALFDRNSRIYRFYHAMHMRHAA